ncbi:pepsin/retropepsin-like aspartic protease family protein [Sandaracinobacteroides saxicola]|uniref:Aspartyl protease n=1 Tax=Sandaracinobacteroides saxicola TaxID=2759707 RepID=A0A7G5IH86_9SPHN|nr:hypothetical protein [Sandaracinobacteroides saxicola]QMW22728.1 hypothetical protein H3309_15715 [Sandaracinobacteroides saxicola]
MPRIEGALQPARGSFRILLPIAVASLPADGESPAMLQFQTSTGLLDTGALRSGLSRSLAAALKLPSRGKIVVNNASGSAPHRLFNFRLGFRLDSADDARLPWFLDDIVQGMDWADHPEFGVLIGMDIISRCDLHIRRTGSFTLTLP